VPSSQQYEVSNRLIAKNTLMLYVRMFLTMIVGLYTSRVVIRVLGVVDYGIYGVVGSVVALFAFLNASMSGATSRFLSYEISSGDEVRLKKTFSSAVIIHCILAVIVFVLLETIGLWFLNHRLVIPQDRLSAARWVFQFSIVSTILSIVQVPYNAAIIAHEKMNVYALVEIINVSLKLLIVFLLQVGQLDKLVLYSVLTCVVSVIVMSICRGYSRIKFIETKSLSVDKSFFKPLLKYSSQTMFAHMSWSIRQQGNNFVLNIVFGPVLNAANGIATTVYGIVNSFGSNILTAFTPQIIKRYAQNDVRQMERLIINASRFSSALVFAIVIPCIFEMDYLLKIWLVSVPDYCSVFCCLSLLSLFTVVTSPVYVGLSATGDIGSYSIVQGFINIVVPFVSFFICKRYLVPEFAYVIVILAQAIYSVFLLFVFRRKIPEFNMRGFLKMTLSLLVSSVIVSAFLFLIIRSSTPSFIRCCLSVFTSFILFCILTYAFMGGDERKVLVSFLKSFIRGHFSSVI